MTERRIARAKKEEEKNTNLRNPFTTISMIFLPGLTLCPVSPSSLGLLSVSTLNAKLGVQVRDMKVVFNIIGKMEDFYHITKLN